MRAGRADAWNLEAIGLKLLNVFIIVRDLQFHKDGIKESIVL